MIRNIGSNALLNMTRTALQFALQLVLTHFVPPADYGLVALITPVIILVSLVGDFGLTSAIVRAPDLSPQAVGGAMRVAGFTSVLTLTVTVGTAAAGLFDQVAPKFGLLACGFAVVVSLALLSAAPRAMFERRLDYGRIALIESLATGIAFLSGVAAAWAGAGVWSYLLYHLLVQGLRLCAMWYIQRGRIAVLGGSIRAALPLLGVGGWVLASNLIGFVARNGDNYIVAALLGPTALGIYALAYQIMLLPVQTLTWPISAVLTATLSRLAGRLDLQRAAMLATVRLVAMISLPAGVFLFIRAPLLLDLLFPPRWHAVSDISARLALAGCLQSITAFIGVLFVAQGRFRLQLGVAFANTAAVLIAVTVAAGSGRLTLVADAYLCLTAATGILHLWMIGHMLDRSLWTVLGAMSAGAAAAAGGLSVMYLLLLVPHAPSGIGDAVLSVVGFAFGCCAVIASQRARILDALAAMRTAGASGAAAVDVPPITAPTPPTLVQRSSSAI